MILDFQINHNQISKKDFLRLKAQFNIPVSKSWFQFYEVNSGLFWLEYKDHFSFLIDSEKRLVRTHHLKKELTSGLKHYIDTQLRSFLLCLKNQECLHGTVLAKRSQCFIFLGDSGQGKSTLAAYMMSKEWTLLSDDLVEFDSNFDYLINPEITYLKLFPSISKRYPPSGRLTGRLNSKTKKELWSYEVSKIQYKPTAFIKLKHSPLKLELRPLSGIESFVALQGSAFNISYWNENRYSTSLRQYTMLSKKYPVFELTYPKKFSSFPLIKNILESLNLDSPCFNSVSAQFTANNF